MAQPKTPAEVFGEQFAARMFDGRKGHGGGPCSYMRLSESDVANLVMAAFEAGEKHAAGVMGAARAVMAEAVARPGEPVPVPADLAEQISAARNAGVDLPDGGRDGN